MFLRKIVRGGADKSYGIQVAKLAGVPESVIARAKELVEELSDADITSQAREIAKLNSNITQRKAVAKPDEVDLNQLSIFDTVKDDDIIRELKELELFHHDSHRRAEYAVPAADKAKKPVAVAAAGIRKAGGISHGNTDSGSGYH